MLRIFLALAIAVLLWVTPSIGAPIVVNGTIDLSSYSGGPTINITGPMSPTPVALNVGDVVTQTITFANGERLRMTDPLDGVNTNDFLSPWMQRGGSGVNFTIGSITIELLDPLSSPGTATVFTLTSQTTGAAHIGPQISNLLADGAFVEFSGIKTTYTVTNLTSSPAAYNQTWLFAGAGNMTVEEALAVPEPASLMIWGLASAGLVCMGRRARMMCKESVPL